MSTISNITSSVISAFQGVTPVEGTTPVEAPTNNAPAFQETLTTQGRAFALGLGAPRNHGDIEAIFAEIATKFGAEVAKANDFANAAQTAGRQTALSAAAGSLAFFATFNTIMINAELNIKKQNQVIGEKTQQINELEAQKAPLVVQRDLYVNEYIGNINQYYSNLSTIQSLQAQLASVEPSRITACSANASSATCQSLTATSNSLQSEISNLQNQNTYLINRNNDIYYNQIVPLTNQINALQAQIDTATAERNAATSSRNQSQADYNAALQTLNTFSLVLIPFAVSLALGQIGAGARASFDMGDNKNGVDNAIAQAVNRLADLSNDMGTLSMIRQALAQMMPSAPDTIVQPAETPPPAPENVAETPQATDRKPESDPVIKPQADPVPPPPPLDENLTDNPLANVLGPTAPFQINLPELVGPQVENIAPVPPNGGVETGQRQSAMEMLRQILANLPVRTDQFLPDPADAAIARGTVQGSEAKPQNAFDIVRQLLEDMLPPSVGNAEEVAARAGELASVLTLLRAAFGQVAQSEAAQTPQIPGASGRLNLVI